MRLPFDDPPKTDTPVVLPEMTLPSPGALPPMKFAGACTTRDSETVAKIGFPGGIAADEVAPDTVVRRKRAADDKAAAIPGNNVAVPRFGAPDNVIGRTIDEDTGVRVSKGRVARAVRSDQIALHRVVVRLRRL